MLNKLVLRCMKPLLAGRAAYKERICGHFSHFRRNMSGSHSREIFSLLGSKKIVLYSCICISCHAACCIDWLWLTTWALGCLVTIHPQLSSRSPIGAIDKKGPLLAGLKGYHLSPCFEQAKRKIYLFICTGGLNNGKSTAIQSIQRKVTREPLWM
jgi:hypothetical protein